MSEPTFLLPSFEVGVSLNGHIEEFLLSPAFYTQLAEEEEEVDPFNFTEIWVYINKHIAEYLFEFGITEAAGPIDTDNLRLVSLVINLHVSPRQVREVVDCEDCSEKYEEHLNSRQGQDDEDEEDDE